MTKRLLAAAFAASLLLPGCGPSARQKPHEGIVIPPLRAFSQPRPERHVLPNGMVVFLMEDHSLPVVDVSGLLRAGTILEPAAKTGLAEICAEVIRTGGTAELPGDALDAKLESAGASISLSVGEDEGSFAMGCLTEDFPTFFPVLADLLRNPAFPQEKIDLAKTQMLGGIARRNDDPDGIRERLFPQILYGADSPYAREPQTWTVEAIGRDDLVDYHRRFFHPDRMILGVWGDFEPADVLARIRAAFEGWPRGTEAVPPPPPVRPEPARSVNLARKPDLNQATIAVGHYGVVRRADDPDWFPLVVMNDILGMGGFGSRLFQNVRTREGLAYGVWSSFGADYTHPGLFQAVCSTKSESAVQAVESVIRQIRRMREEPPTPEELANSKESIANGMVFQFDTKGKILQRWMRYEFRSWPTDYIERFLAGVAAVTAEDVQRVARKHLRPDDLSILVIGNPDAFDKPLSALGPVTEIPLERPPPASSSDRPSPEALAAGRRVMEAAARALGGLAALEKVETLTIEGDATVEAAPGMTVPLGLKVSIAYPDRIRIDMKTPQGDVAQGFDGRKAWAQPPGMPAMDLPASETRNLRSQIEESEMRLIAAAAKGEIEASLAAETTADGRTLDEVRVRTPSGATSRFFFDRSDRRLVKLVESGPAGTEETVFADYREVGGLSFPFRRSMKRGGGPAQEMTLQKVTVNPDLPAATFEKPK